MPNAVPQSASSAHPLPSMLVPRPILLLSLLVLSLPCTRCRYITHSTKLIVPRNTSMGIAPTFRCDAIIFAPHPHVPQTPSQATMVQPFCCKFSTVLLYRYMTNTC